VGGKGGREGEAKRGAKRTPSSSPSTILTAPIAAIDMERSSIEGLRARRLLSEVCALSPRPLTDFPSMENVSLKELKNPERRREADCCGCGGGWWW
jgi:hypothetical protein